MHIPIEHHANPPGELLSLLASHLPHSLPLLRRLQFAHRNAIPGTAPGAAAASAGTKTPPLSAPAHVLWTAVSAPGGHFAAAHLDLSRSRETECWLYSTLEDTAATAATATAAAAAQDELVVAICRPQILALLRRIRAVEAAYSASAAAASAAESGGRRSASCQICIGSLHEAVRQALIREGVRVLPTEVKRADVEWDFYDKWLFRVEDLPGGGGGEAPGEGMCWDVVRSVDDARLVRSRTNIPRSEATLLTLPSVMVRLSDGTPIAWAFLGVDGSLSSLHCEEPYRGRGLAKAVASRLMRTRLDEYGDDGWCSADVSTTNQQSQGVCRSLGGKPRWIVSWYDITRGRKHQ